MSKKGLWVLFGLIILLIIIFIVINSMPSPREEIEKEVMLDELCKQNPSDSVDCECTQTEQKVVNGGFTPTLTGLECYNRDNTTCILYSDCESDDIDVSKPCKEIILKEGGNIPTIVNICIKAVPKEVK